MGTSKLQKVVIVGRTNVGKSTLFNRLSVDVKSITFDQEAVTLDFIQDTVCWQDKCFDLIDTGGISFRKTADQILNEARRRAIELLKKADLIIFVCDGKVGLLPEDREISKLLHKLGKTVLLAINKMDVKVAEEHKYEFERLGYKQMFPISAEHGLGMADVLEAIVNLLPAAKKIIEKEPSYKVVILGKPNVGKSSLMNLLLKRERAIVSPVPGTTREALIECIRFYQEDIQIADTAGVRRKRGIKEPLESLMVQSTLRAVRNADIVLLMIDAAQGEISDQELKLAFYTFENQKKALILLFNKQDLLDEYTKGRLEFSLEEYPQLTKKAVRLDVSCKTEKNIGRIFPLVKQDWQRHSQWISDQDLTHLFKEALQRTPLYRVERLLIVYKAKQVATSSITILLRVNESKWFGPSQLNFFDNVLRSNYDLHGVPVKFITRKGR